LAIGAREDVELADAVQKAGEHRRIRIHAAEAACHGVRHGRDGRTSLPELIERLLEPLQRVHLLQLRHGEGDGGAAHHVEPHARDRGAQLHDRLAGEIDRRGVGDLHEAGRERRLRADDPHHLVLRDLLIGEHLTHAQRDIRKARQIHFALRQLGCQRLHEGEGLRITDGLGNLCNGALRHGCVLLRVSADPARN
jgi:hypothetical protein